MFCGRLVFCHHCNGWFDNPLQKGIRMQLTREERDDIILLKTTFGLKPKAIMQFYNNSFSQGYGRKKLTLKQIEEVLECNMKEL